MLVAFLTMRKTIVSLQSDVQELRTTAMPILNRTRETLEKVTPKIESVATDVADLAHRLKEQSVEFEAVAGEILDRVHRQTSRVDNMFTGMVDGVEHASNLVADTITRPVRQGSPRCWPAQRHSSPYWPPDADLVNKSMSSPIRTCSSSLKDL